MPNPPLLLCDSDALVQLFIANNFKPLQALKNTYHMQPSIVLEVDVELRWMRKYKNRFVPQLDKALRNGLLTKLDQGAFQSLLSTATPGMSWGNYQALGQRYELVVQRGEAYTHAAAVCLGLPAMSNDGKAVLTLKGQMMSVASPVIRLFDLLVFCHENGVLTTKECDDIRSDLLSNGEGLPGPFQNASFINGSKSFPCRLKSGDASKGPFPQPANHFDPLTICP